MNFVEKFNLTNNRYSSQTSRHIVIKIMPRLGKANYKASMAGGCAKLAMKLTLARKVNSCKGFTAR